MIDYNIANIQQDFKRFYDENLQYRYEKLEPVRKDCLKFFCISASLYILFLISFYWIMNNSTNYISEFIKNTFSSKAGDTIFIGINLIFIGFCYYPILKYREETKSLVMEKILSFWGNFRYKKNHISPEFLEKSELFGSFNDSETDDSFIGEYKNINISVSETNLLVKGNRGSMSIFKGIVILLDFNKKFNGKTIIKNRGRVFARFDFRLFLLYFLLFFLGLLSVFFIWMSIIDEEFTRGIFCIIPIIFTFYLVVKQLKNMSKKLANQKVNLEEITFNKYWNILSDDQIEARYILTPVLMEKINEIKRLYKGKYIDFSFFENKMMIAIHTRKNMFETTSLFKPALEYDKVKEVVYQLYSIFSIIDTLK